MTTRVLLGSIKYGVLVSAVAFSVQAHADARDPMALQLATGQYVTPTALRGRGPTVPEPGLACLSELRRRRGGALAAEPRRHDAGDPLRRSELALQAGRHRRHRQLDSVHLPLRRERGAPGCAAAHAGHPADQRPRRSGLLAGRQHALRRGRPRRRGLRLYQERRRLGAVRDDGAGPRRQRCRRRRQPERQRPGDLRRRHARWWSPTTTTTRSA